MERLFESYRFLGTDFLAAKAGYASVRVGVGNSPIIDSADTGQ